MAPNRSHEFKGVTVQLHMLQKFNLSLQTWQRFTRQYFIPNTKAPGLVVTENMLVIANC